MAAIREVRMRVRVRVEIDGVTEVQRFTYKPGDRFVLHVEHQVCLEEVREIISRFRQAAQLPDDVPVIVFSSGIRLEIVEDSERHPEWEACKK